jgi:CDP-diacylglycerol---glycerol-3-phosphate 3-phosphatidyltransferase
LFDGRWRNSVERGLEPVGSGIRRTGLSADHLTGLGLMVAAACAVAIGTGRLGLALALLILSAVPDLLDGAVAKASGTASPRGAFFDSVADRVTDSLVLGGLAWYLAGEDGGRAALLPFAVLAASTLISYERAKAESLGYTARGGLMERAERIIAIALGLAFSAFLVPILWLMLGLTLLTAVQRFVRVWRQASTPRPRPERRWRTWREVAAERRSTRTRHAARRSERWPTRRRAGTRP